MGITREARAHLLRDLALIALALAHGADQALSDREVDTIEALLHDWQDEAEDADVTGALQHAVDAYGSGDALAAVDSAIQRFGEAATPGVRARFWRDLRSLAGADGVLHPVEEDFLHQLGGAWGVGADARE